MYHVKHFKRFESLELEHFSEGINIEEEQEKKTPTCIQTKK